ncbi:class I SAM-dependent methyltransferase [Cupriavidus gilardii]|uniref:Class I SAM-dependent methyltransferase n=1 Tax=Cupriavidus gilardii TaxID=82541 RepID=A0ABY4VKL2_9BURK|nr:class I SAM-dependent methyltransferase [Cupriavidus gilardii]MCT9012858.1 class I SAM-dependent methyltransferase [Cupriavidus gilardii]MCT9052412.1 class I SAM-dependent methyltransferase [Cupriavidus gilardii]USE77728.1 class I SAM-dependent methyltransferase [Cupriavidus gilardii]UXC38800.1 class I SAM-dependent methyltransferase [Cupriavidus gilardii]WNG68240.1 class I SAM-dependent methyltransferase [Cupriavidus gilardii]
MNGWSNYYRRSEKRGSSPLLSEALRHVLEEGCRQAVDLGCGAGIEVQQLIRAGWQVLAIDREPEAITRTTSACSGTDEGVLTTWLVDFEQLSELPASNLIHAGLALPFCRPEHFRQLWDQIRQALVPGGVYVGHFFGNRHGWSPHSHLTFHTEQEIRSLCHGLDVLLLRESESQMGEDSDSINWHRFDLIARRPVDQA